VGDFEYHDQRSRGRKPEIEIYVPVQPDAAQSGVVVAA